ncbi:MAG: DEAD/DEAH box helicase [Planctomycetota bacterium]
MAAPRPQRRKSVPAAPGPAGIALAVSRHGALHAADHADAGPLSAAAVGRIRAAFGIGVGAGLLHLAGRELKTELPASLAFGRTLGTRYLLVLARQTELGDTPLPPPAALPDLLERTPPMRGAEYLTADGLADAWAAVDAHTRARLRATGVSVHDFLQAQNKNWHGAGRVVFHLAEQKQQPRWPFAFLATYAGEVGRNGALVHVPLGRAVEQARGDRQTLLHLLRPVHEAAQRSPLIAQLVESQEIYQPVAWDPDQAWRFLKAVPECEASGVVVRVPDWWSGQRARPQARLTLGVEKCSGVGLDAMLDFDAGMELDGEELTPEEIAEVLSGGLGLRLMRGRWVEVDPEKLHQAIEQLEQIADGATGGKVSFRDGMRLLADLEAVPAADGVDDEPFVEWATVQAGPWLRELLTQLRDPAGDVGAIDALQGTLRPYQRQGVQWLTLLGRLGQGACLADDMGLGKTVQVIAAMLVLRRQGERGPHLLVVPASLLANWHAELARFAPSLSVEILHRSEQGAGALAALVSSPPAVDVWITTYETVVRQPALAEHEYGLLVVDEAQAIKNARTRRARAVRALRCRARIALTGTPVENHLADLWSLFDFLCPGLLGGRAQFGKWVQRLEAGASGYAPLRRLIQPYVLRRMKTDRAVIADLPDKTEISVFCGLSKPQAKLYGAAVAELSAKLGSATGMERRGLVLATLMRLKQICNHPSHWLKQADYPAAESGKLLELREIAAVLAARQEKLLVFTQFREMVAPLAQHLEEVFRRPGLVLHGQTRVGARRGLVAEFQRDEGPPFFVLSLRAGGTGLNLTQASHVVHFDRWWNPAVEDQATDRAFRIGQTQPVLVHKMVCRGTIEERLDAMLEEKKALARDVLARGVETALTELEADELLGVLSLDLRKASLDG